MCRFYWSGDAALRGIHWLKWDSLCRSKLDGGIGFRDFKAFNTALVGKNWWRILKQPNSLLSRVFRSVYFPQTSLLMAKKHSLCLDEHLPFKVDVWGGGKVDSWRWSNHWFMEGQMAAIWRTGAGIYGSRRRCPGAQRYGFATSMWMMLVETPPGPRKEEVQASCSIS